MTPLPNSVEPVVSSREVLMHRPDRALLATMVAMKAAHLLDHGLVGPGPNQDFGCAMDLWDGLLHW